MKGRHTWQRESVECDDDDITTNINLTCDDKKDDLSDQESDSKSIINNPYNASAEKLLKSSSKSYLILENKIMIRVHKLVSPIFQSNFTKKP